MTHTTPNSASNRALPDGAATLAVDRVAEEAVPVAAAFEGLTVTVHHPQRHVVLVRVHGEVDLVTAPFLGDLLAPLCSPDPELNADPCHVADVDPDRDRDAGAARRLLVCDLSGVEFLAAVGVGALVDAATTANAHGVALHLIAETRPVTRVLSLCGLDERLPVSTRLVDVLGDTTPGTSSR